MKHKVGCSTGIFLLILAFLVKMPIVFVLGGLICYLSLHWYSSYRDKIRPYGSFDLMLLKLGAAVMAADGYLSRRELDRMETYLKENFNEHYAKARMHTLNDILEFEIDHIEIAQLAGMHLTEGERYHLLMCLFGIGFADDELADTERNMIFEIGDLFGFSKTEIQEIQEMASVEVKEEREQAKKERRQRRTNQTWSRSSLDQAYQTLGLSKGASDTELTKRFRDLAKKYHPDMLGSLPKEHQDAAARKFQAIKEAFDKIKKSRGLN